MSGPGTWMQLAAAFAAGALLGWLYFRGLRLTIDRLPESRHPGASVLLSFMLRASAAVAAFVLIAHLAQGHGVIAALLGFVGARTVMIRRARRELPREAGGRGAS